MSISTDAQETKRNLIFFMLMEITGILWFGIKILIEKQLFGK